MAKLMWICGILLIAAGIALGALVFVATVPTAGLTIDSSAILLVGGVLALGLGGVIDAVRQQRVAVAAAIPAVAAPEAEAGATAIPEFGPRGAKAAAAAATAAATAVAVEEAAAPEAPAEEVSRPTRETIQALENARQRIEQAFDARKAAAAAKEEPVSAAAPEEEEAEVAEEPVAEEEVVDNGQLYVVEERVIRRHPARVLSDGTVEAETAEGWMRFENLEHLDEYLDAMEPARG